MILPYVCYNAELIASARKKKLGFKPANDLQFEGGVVVISHDSQLLSVVCDDAERSEVWLVEDGKVEKYDGYFQDYKDELMKEISDEMDEDEVYQRPDAIPAS